MAKAKKREEKEASDTYQRRNRKINDKGKTKREYKIQRSRALKEIEA